MKAIVVLFSFVVMAGSICAAESEQPVEDFSLLDMQGNIHRMSEYSSSRGIVFLSSSSECPMSKEISAAYSKIESRFFDLRFKFMELNFGEVDGVSPGRRQQDVDIPVLLDENRLVSRSLGIRKTNEVLVFDPKTFQVIYRGQPDHNLEVALFTILAGEEVMNAISNGPGCEVD